MSNVEFSDVQLINLSTLMTIRDHIKRDAVSACCKFGLHADQATFLVDLPVDQIFAIVANLGQECLFPPRQDLFSLLKLPASLAGPIASVHPPHKAASPSPQESLRQHTTSA